MQQGRSFLPSVSKFQVTWAALHLSAAIMHFGSAIYHMKRILNVNEPHNDFPSDDGILGV